MSNKETVIVGDMVEKVVPAPPPIKKEAPPEETKPASVEEKPVPKPKIRRRRRKADKTYGK